MTEVREPGWYWVYTRGWECAEWRGEYWYVKLSVGKWYDGDFHLIGPRIEEPKEGV